MTVVHFTSVTAFHDWLEAHHATATELWVGFHRKDSGKGGLTYSEVLDEALCFGWIDGIRKKVDATRYTNRFTPRRSRSTWSVVNIRRAKQLQRLGRMQPAGLRVFAARNASRSGIYSFEQRQHPSLDPASARRLRADVAAWAFFQRQPPSYRRTATWWVVSAKRPDTREKRLQILIASSAASRRIPPLAPAKKGIEPPSLRGAGSVQRGRGPVFPSTPHGARALAIPPHPSDRAMSEAVTDQELSDVVEQLPPVATVIQRLLAVLRDPLSEVSDIARLVLVDTSLASQILRLANSAHYGLAEQVSSIDQAIQHVGVNEITRLATLLSARQLFQRALTRYKIAPHLMWQHTLAVALGAEVVAQRIFGDMETAYLVGMLHGIGFVALDGVAAARNLGPRPAKAPLLEWERANFGADNAATASRVLHYWKFPAAIADAVAARYIAPDMETIVQPGGLLYTASFLAETIPAGLPPEAGLFSAPTKALEAFIVRPPEIRDFEFAVRQKLSRVRALLNLA